MRRAIATALVAIPVWIVAGWPVPVSAHDVGTHAGSQEPAVPFVVAIGLSVVLSVAFGLGIVSYYRSALGSAGHNGVGTRREVAVLVVVLGLVALLAALTQASLLTIGAGILGGVIAWVGRTRGLSPHAGCADAALGAILAHRVVEGILIAGIYATTTSFGVLALALLTGHAIAETAAVGGLYAPVGRGWGIASVVAVQLGFVAGAVGGGVLAGGLSPPVVTALLASVGGLLFVAGATEFRVVTVRNRDHLRA
ncbi:hypothetical protein [Natrinema ejinorense]|uniref:Uncharacterized protein n=1 Tax=Natrinema ejinorense TaxID=373386 RepID=A0A2A5QWD7_9EURY|nr:hypothetical protein [Natrinema ejinorense]PCR91114.1 hypothetical protein CP557_11605 [Natrinema ejinorense]